MVYSRSSHVVPLAPFLYLGTSLDLWPVLSKAQQQLLYSPEYNILVRILPPFLIILSSIAFFSGHIYVQGIEACDDNKRNNYLLRNQKTHCKWYANNQKRIKALYGAWKNDLFTRSRLNPQKQKN